MKKYTFFVFIFAILFLISCKKEPTLNVVSSLNSNDTLCISVVVDMNAFNNSYSTCSQSIIDHCLKNDFQTIKFSYDKGYPHDITAYIYSTQKDFHNHNLLFTMTYHPKSTNSSQNYNIIENSDEYIYDITY